MRFRGRQGFGDARGLAVANLSAARFFSRAAVLFVVVALTVGAAKPVATPTPTTTPSVATPAPVVGPVLPPTTSATPPPVQGPTLPPTTPAKKTPAPAPKHSSTAKQTPASTSKHATASTVKHAQAPAPKPAAPQASTPTGPAPIAGAFVFPVGDETNFMKPHDGETAGFYVSDGYLAKRGRHKERTHYGVDLSNGQGGYTVRAIGSGTVVFADPNALVKVRRTNTVRTPVVVKGKKTYKTSTRTRVTYKWRTGWGNYVVVRHALPSGETVFSLYAHMMPKSVLVTRGEVVAAGQPIGRVGHSGHATSSHLHIEIRKATVTNPDQQSDEVTEEDERTPEEVSYLQLSTIDPMAFLEAHVRTFDDLEPGTWQARYALAACRDGVVVDDTKDFDPNNAITRAEYYRELVTAFHLGTPFTTKKWESTVDALVDAEVLDPSTAHDNKPDDKISRSDALELILRCLDQHEAHARNLSNIDAMQVSLDFNTQFAGIEAAAAAQSKARAAAAAETKERQEAEAARVAKARKAAKAAGKTSRVKAKPVNPVTPSPRLDPGFESLAQSQVELTRAESCLLLASALRMNSARVSALQLAATRVGGQG